MKVYMYYVLADKHVSKFEGRIVFNRFKPLVEGVKIGEVCILPNRAGYPAQYLMYIGVEEFDDDYDLRRRIYDVSGRLIRSVVWGNNKEVNYKVKEGDVNGE